MISSFFHNQLKKNSFISIIISKRIFLSLIKKISGSLNVYERYLSSKNKNTLGYKLKIEEAEKLMKYINAKIREIEKWLKGKED